MVHLSKKIVLCEYFLHQFIPIFNLEYIPTYSFLSILNVFYLVYASLRMFLRDDSETDCMELKLKSSDIK